MKLTIKTSSIKALEKFRDISAKENTKVTDILDPLLYDMKDMGANDVTFSTNMENKPNQKITIRLSRELEDDDIQKTLHSAKKSAK